MNSVACWGATSLLSGTECLGVMWVTLGFVRTGDWVVLDAYADRWALITGASSGIGAEFAQKLAARGMHLIMVARRKELMEQLAADLDTRHGTKSQIICADLSDPEQVVDVARQIRDLGINVELLINNAGFGFVGQVDDVDPERMAAMIRLNIAALTDLTYRFLPGMLERGHGAIINVSSVAAFQPVSFMSVYSAGKAYVLHFSESLWAEVRDRGVTVMALCPGTTETEFFDVAGVPTWLQKHSSHTSERVVKLALKALEKRRQYVIPGWKNYLLSLGCRLAQRKTVVLQSMRFFRPKRRDDETQQTNGE
jgi:uncharacterized protein